MSYSDDAVKAKLSSLNETQDSIVTVAQWIMFHRRYADRTVQIWLQRLKDAGSSKRLNLIYLANEVVQQSKARKKDDFLHAFSPVIADAAYTAYKGATHEVQLKIRRVTEVWQQRQIFDQSIQKAIDARIDELDKSRPTTKKATLGGSLFAAETIPASLKPIATSLNSLTKADSTARPLLSNADIEWAKYQDSAAPVPSAPVNAARLGTLLKNLAAAEGAVTARINARQHLLMELEKLLTEHRTFLEEDQKKQGELSSSKESIETTKREVEDAIMAGLVNADTDGPNGEIERPDVEALTPPSAPNEPEGFVGLDGPAGYTTTTGAEPIHELPPKQEPAPAEEPPPVLETSTGTEQSKIAAADEFLANLGDELGSNGAAQNDASTEGAFSSATSNIPTHRPSDVPAGIAKKRKLALSGFEDEEAEFAAMDDGGIDDVVEEMLGQ